MLQSPRSRRLVSPATRWASPHLIAGLLVTASVLIFSSALADEESPAGLARLGAWFEAHPEYKERKSSGWKPYNRELWFQSARNAPAGVSAAALRLEHFERARSLLREDDPSWFFIGPVEYSGRCVSVDFDPTNPSVVYVGSAGGGLWKSTDGGDTWSTSTDGLPTLAVGAVCALQADPNIVLIGTGEGTGVGFISAGKGIFGIGILKSTDAGATWSSTSLSYEVPSNHGFSVIEDNPITGTILAGANDGLWRSTDQGDTWTRVVSGGNFFDVKWQPGSANRVYVARGKDPFVNSQNSNGVFVSTDDGLTFTLAGTGQPPGSNIAKTKIAVTPADPDYIYAHYVSASSFGSIGIYRSTDGGATWQARIAGLNMTGGQGWYNNVIAVDPNDAERVVAGGVNLYRSSNGGTNFINMNSSAPFGNDVVPHWDNHALVYESGSNSNLWVATDGGPWRSTDDGMVWTGRRAGIATYQFYDIGVAQSDPLFTMGGTQDNGMPGRADEDSWFQSTFVADGFVHNIDPADADIVYSEWQNGNHIKSTDRGQTWNPIQTGIFGAGAWITPVDQDQNDGDHLYTSTGSGIFRTVNGGASWSRVGLQLATWLSMNPSNGDIVWTAHNTSGVWHTTDDGANWTQSTTYPATGGIIKVQADPSDPACAFVVSGGYGTGLPHIQRTTDFGATWMDVTGDFPDQPASTLVVDPMFPNEWYVGSDIGVWRSTNGGVNWVPFGTGLVNAVVVDLEIRRSARKLVAGTYGRAVWEIDLRSDPASADEPLVAHRELMLDTPFPSPVVSETTFRFAASPLSDGSYADSPAPGSSAPDGVALPRGSVRLDVFDVEGRRVSTVVESAPADGTVRMVRWSRAGLADGVYFARLQSGNRVATRKVVVSR